MKAKKISALLLTTAILASSAVLPVQAAEETAAEAAETTEEAAQTPAEGETKVPKYVFLFIGDGMSYPQIQTTNYYLSAMADDGDDILTSQNNLT